MEEDDYEALSDTGSGGGKRLSDEEYAAARELYELGKRGLTELAKEFGVVRTTLWRRFEKDGVERGSRVHEIQDEIKKQEMRYSARRAQWIEETRVQGFQALKQVRMVAQKRFVEAAQANRAPEIDDDNFKALQRYNKLLVENIDASLRILDADNYFDLEELPILQIEDLTSEKILQHHINTGVLPEDATVEDLNLEILQ